MTPLKRGTPALIQPLYDLGSPRAGVPGQPRDLDLLHRIIQAPAAWMTF